MDGFIVVCEINAKSDVVGVLPVSRSKADCHITKPHNSMTNMPRATIDIFFLFGDTLFFEEYITPDV